MTHWNRMEPLYVLETKIGPRIWETMLVQLPWFYLITGPTVIHKQSIDSASASDLSILIIRLAKSLLGWHDTSYSIPRSLCRLAIKMVEGPIPRHPISISPCMKGMGRIRRLLMLKTESTDLVYCHCHWDHNVAKPSLPFSVENEIPASSFYLLTSDPILKTKDAMLATDLELTGYSTNDIRLPPPMAPQQT